MRNLAYVRYDRPQTDALFGTLRNAADPEPVAAIEALVRDGEDRALCRINVLKFSAERKLDEEKAITAFLHASRLGLFEMNWNVLCPGCGGVLESGTPAPRRQQAGL